MWIVCHTLAHLFQFRVYEFPDLTGIPFQHLHTLLVFNQRRRFDDVDVLVRIKIFQTVQSLHILGRVSLDLLFIHMLIAVGETLVCLLIVGH